MEEAEEEWDPIEDIVENERRTYVDLSSDLAGAKASSPDEQSGCYPKSTTRPEGPTTVAVTKSKKAKKKAITQSGEAVPDKSNHETPAEIRKRLKEGVELSYASGFHMAGTIGMYFLAPNFPYFCLHRRARHIPVSLRKAMRLRTQHSCDHTHADLYWEQMLPLNSRTEQPLYLMRRSIEYSRSSQKLNCCCSVGSCYPMLPSCPQLLGQQLSRIS